MCGQNNIKSNKNIRFIFLNKYRTMNGNIIIYNVN